MPEPSPSSQAHANAHGLTDVGRQRRHNEDCILVKPTLGLFVVADGMGGHNAGEVASKLVATSLDNFFEATRYEGSETECIEEDPSLLPEARRLVAAIRKANHDVYVISNTYAQHHGMGSTVVALHLAGSNVHIAHVGDSRCYRVRAGVIQQLTRDHSLVNDALDMKPDLTKEELARLPKNIITRALGMKDSVKIDVRSDAAEDGDLFILCSDGLSGMVSPDEILKALALAGELSEACELLIAEANDAGGNDNISAVIVRIEHAADARLAEDSGTPTQRSQLSLTEDDVSLDVLDDKHPSDHPGARAHSADQNGGQPDDDTPLDASRIDLPDLNDFPFPLTTVREPAGDAVVASGEPQDAYDDVPRCPYCRFELFAGNRFCVECGQPIDFPVP
jgi:protein phosphatase